MSLALKKRILTEETNRWLIVAMIVASTIKILLVQNLPIYAITYTVHDDRMMVNMAQSLLAGEWLGTYNQMTLVKGIMYPLFLALCSKFGVSYLLGVTLSYVFACVVMIYVLRKVIKSKACLFCIYIVLLFDPITMSIHAFQRVYRCSLTPAHIILLIACFFAMYLYRKESKIKMMIWAIFAGLSLGVMWNTREDGIWVIPFVIGVILITVIKIFYEFKNSIKEAVMRFGMTLVPLLLLFFMNNMIALINYSHYGIYTTNELNDSAYTDFMKAIYSVKPNNDIDYVSVPRETIDRICDESATLKSIQNNINTTLDAWEIHGKVAGDMEVEHGWLFWALRDAVAAAGYYVDSQTANSFYFTAANEIEMALEDGRLERRAIMPSVMMAPWKPKFFGEMLTEMPKTIKSVISYDGVMASVEESIDSDRENKGIRLYESLTNNLAIYPTKLVTNINGWMFAKGNEEWQAVNLVDKNRNRVHSIYFMESPDIYEYFLKEFNISYYNAKQCRFSINLSNLDKDIFPLQVEITMSSGEKEYFDLLTVENEELIMLFDNVDVMNIEDTYVSYSKEKINIVNRVGNLYKVCSPVLFVIGMIGYLYITVNYFISIKRKHVIYEEQWLLASGVLGSFIVLVGGITYTTISAYNAVTHLYLSAAYPLCTLFGVVSVTAAWNLLRSKYNFKINIHAE